MTRYLKLIAAFTVALLFALLTTVFVAAPANASDCDDSGRQNVTHYNPDDGDDTQFYIYGVKHTSTGACYFTYGYIYEGYSGYGIGFRSVEQIYVPPGKKIKCKDPILLAIGITQWENKWTDTGWHSVGTYPWYASHTCVSQLD